jgi:hypothetical protein
MRPLLLAALLSCADDGIGWDLPADMLPEERAAFGEACERWNHVAIRQQHIAEPGDGNRRVLMVLREHMANGPDTDGETGSGVMRLARGMERGEFLMVTVHEQGHALGLRHIDGVGVMHAHAGQVEFSDDDIAECRRAKACR